MSTVNKVRITSPVKTDDVIFLKMEKAAAELRVLESELSIELVERRKMTIKDFFKNDDSPVIVIGQKLPVLYFSADDKIVYHENTMNFKLKRFNKYREVPPLIDIMPVSLNEQAVIVDATMGMGNDLMLMVQLMKQAEFHAYEINPLIYFVIKHGIQQYYDNDLTKRIHFHYGSAADEVIANADVVYVDPMFETTVSQQSGMQVLSRYTTRHDHDHLMDIVQRARCVVLKAHFRSPLFKRYGFQVTVRRSSKSHFGILVNKKM